MALSIRPLKLADLPAIEEIQRLNPTASQWTPADYLGYHTLIAEIDDRPVAFIALLDLPLHETEILNLAVHPAYQRQGIATALLNAIPAKVIFLDVRISNLSALAFYRRHGFVKTGHRRKYYSHPVEDAIMMSRGR